jgi:hypothetical protein
MAVETTGIGWLNQLELEQSLERSRSTGISVLLDFRDPDCAGCEELERSTYSDPGVIEAVSEFTLPVRVLTGNPDRITEEILSRYIAISTPTIQLISGQGTVDHFFRGAPRHTRLALSQWNRERTSGNRDYCRVYHESVGCLPPPRFLAQLLIGRGRAALNSGRFEEAERKFDELLSVYGSDDTAVSEATYWKSKLVSRANSSSVVVARV